MSQDASAVFSNLHWEVWRNLWPQVIAAFSSLCWGQLYDLFLVLKETIQWVLWTGLCPWPWAFDLTLSTLNILLIPAQVAEHGLSRTWGKNISSVYHTVLLYPLKLNFCLMENDLEFFLSVSDLSNHASIPPAILLSASYVLGAGLSSRETKMNSSWSILLRISCLWGWRVEIIELIISVFFVFFNNLEMSKLLG